MKHKKEKEYEDSIVALIDFLEEKGPINSKLKKIRARRMKEEDEWVQEILDAEKEKPLHGDLRKLMKKFK